MKGQEENCCFATEYVVGGSYSTAILIPYLLSL